MEKKIITLVPYFKCRTDLLFKGAQLHQHAHWEFTLFLSGRCRNIINNKEFLLKKGDVTILCPSHFHIIDNESDNYAHRDIYIYDNEMREICGNLFDDKFYQRLCDKNNPIVFQLRDGVCQELNHIAETIEVLYMTHKNEELIMPLVKSIIIFILGQAYMSENNNQLNVSTWLTSQMAYLRQPAVFCQSIDSIIYNTGYSHTQYLRRFKQDTGITLVKYLIELRVNYAKLLLTTSTKSILEIANDIGYDSVNYFIRIFKEKTGMTPLQYRLEQKK